MKSLQLFLRFSTSSPSKNISLLFSSFSAPSPPAAVTKSINLKSLSQEELAKINLLIPRLCYSSHLFEAIRLVDASLLTIANPPIYKSLSLSILIHSLSSQPDMTLSISLLNRLNHNPLAHPSLLPISTMLISSYFHKSKPKDAFKVFNWMSRPGSPCVPDAALYAVLVGGFCRHGLNVEALVVLRAMVGANFVPGGGLRKRVFRSLLKEARIREAKELDDALGFGFDGGQGVKKVLLVLQQIIANWTD